MFRLHKHLPVHALALAATAAVCTLVATAQPAAGLPAPGSTPVVVVVTVAKPWYALRSVVVSKMRDTIPVYESVPGLAYTGFSLAYVHDALVWSARALAHASPGSPYHLAPHYLQSAQLRRPQGSLHDHALGELPIRCLNARESAEALP